MNAQNTTSTRAAALCIALAAGLCHTSALAAGKPVIDWLVSDLPPASMPVMGQLTDGYTDTVVKMLFAEWPEAEHRIVVANIGRAMANLAEGGNACFTTAIVTPERERLAYFAHTQLIPPMMVVTRPDVLPKLQTNSRGEVLPATLFDRTDLRGIVVSMRSYSPTLDALLNLRSATSGIFQVSAADSGSNVLKMLNQGRGDYTLEYGFMLAYHQSLHPELKEQPGLKALPLAGSSPILVGIACPHTEWGRTMVMRIDAIIARISQRRAYQAALERWIAPETLRHFRPALSAFYRQRANPTPAAKYPVLPAPP